MLGIPRKPALCAHALAASPPPFDTFRDALISRELAQTLSTMHSQCSLFSLINPDIYPPAIQGAWAGCRLQLPKEPC